MNGLKMPGGQNLEEVLASIRKTLAEEPPAQTDSPPGSQSASLRPGDGDAAKQSVPEKAAPERDALPDKLAGALNGVANGKLAGDEDLDDLLAPEKTLAPGPVSPDKEPPPSAASETRDPLWFLKLRPTRDESVVDASPAPGKDDIEPANDFKLSRPERGKLPPLFGGGAEAAPDVRAPATSGAPKAAETPAPAAGAVPNGIFPSMSARASSSLSVPAEAVPAVKDMPVVEEDKPKQVMSPPASPRPEDAPQAAPPPDAGVAATGAKPETPRASTEKPAGGQNRSALEEMIGQLLEPVLRQWLENNLPRIVEAAIREEVARGLEAQRARGELKI